MKQMIYIVRRVITFTSQSPLTTMSLHTTLEGAKKEYERHKGLIQQRFNPNEIKETILELVARNNLGEYDKLNVVADFLNE